MLKFRIYPCVDPTLLLGSTHANLKILKNILNGIQILYIHLNFLDQRSDGPRSNFEFWTNVLKSRCKSIGQTFLVA
jgi:hypothetical protein